ncbi:hypothetical protein VFPBJ_06587 [Purpureocillium lilacinum]|uniref:Uncharacterized protein n=1 Tax=Purpureocillium lilacinum TaxID=33203 RepID=A0A179GKQ0_PURLI|nr:hypothetical protein VFPBJ_06587 [Purpureocillium lilacinum]
MDRGKSCLAVVVEDAEHGNEFLPPEEPCNFVELFDGQVHHRPALGTITASHAKQLLCLEMHRARTASVLVGSSQQEPPEVDSPLARPSRLIGFGGARSEPSSVARSNTLAWESAPLMTPMARSRVEFRLGVGTGCFTPEEERVVHCIIWKPS